MKKAQNAFRRLGNDPKMSENRLNRRDFCLIFAACLFCLAMAAILTRGNYLYGSKTDWISQHTVFPEYFRNLFYETGKLLPSLAPGIGAGENIYYFSYYGLLSPVVLFSYLLPFVSMTAYLTAASLISVLLTVILFYLWARKRFDRTVAFVLDLMLAFSGPLLLHSHRHIMFVIYLPFLIAALHFTDRFFESGRIFGLAVCTALVIFTNYFFSVAAICAITVYAVFRFAERREAKDCGRLLPDLIKHGGSFAGLILIAILSAAVLLLPTARALLDGRDVTNVQIGWRELLPTVRIQALTFDSYSMGLSSFLILSVIDQIFYGNSSKRFLALTFAAFLTCPILLYLLNGFEYLEAKVLIPFLPLALILCGSTLQRLLDGSFRLRTTLPIFGIVSLVGLFADGLSRAHRWTYLADLMLVLLFAAVCAARKGRILQKVGRYLKFALPLVLIVPLCSCVTVNFSDSLATVSAYRRMNSDDLNALFDYLAQRDPSFYRTAVAVDEGSTPNKIYGADHYSDTVYSSLEDQTYNHFTLEEMYSENAHRNRALLTRSKNPCYTLYMANKYWIAMDGDYVPKNYTEITRRGNAVLYGTDEAFPLGYATDALMSRVEYERLSYPQQIEALLRYTVVEKELPDTGFSGSMKPVSVDGIFEDCPFLEKTAEGYRFDRDTDDKQEGRGSRIYRYTLPEDCAGRLILLRFCVDNTIGEQSEDVSISVNGVANKLTDADWKYYNHNELFEYAITLQGEDGRELIFSFPNKDYAIRDAEVWLCDPTVMKEQSDGLDAFVCDPERTGGDSICGTIHVQRDGYFNLSFVYSEGYRVYVDGNAVEPERVDTCFLGFPISAGEHTVEIRYTAPGLAAGKVLSAVGVALLAGLFVWDVCAIRREKRKKA